MYNVAILGCGEMGTAHAGAWSQRTDARVVAVADPQEERVRKLCEPHGAHGYADWRDAVRHPGIDIVSICTPACFHAEMAVFAHEHGKHVLCEKPMALTLDEADRMIEAAAANGVQLSISHQFREWARFQAYKRLVDAGRLGGPLMLRFIDVREVRPKLAMHQLRLNGGPVHDVSGHFLDLALWLTDDEPVRVFASGHVFGGNKERLRTIPPGELGMDAADITVCFRQGHTCTFTIHWGLPEETPSFGHEYVMGPDGYATGEGPGIRFCSGETTAIIELEAQPEGPVGRIQDMITAIETESPPPVDGNHGRRLLRLIHGALESVRRGQAIDL